MDSYKQECLKELVQTIEAEMKSAPILFRCYQTGCLIIVLKM